MQFGDLLRFSFRKIDRFPQVSFKVVEFFRLIGQILDQFPVALAYDTSWVRMMVVRVVKKDGFPIQGLIGIGHDRQQAPTIDLLRDSLT